MTRFQRHHRQSIAFAYSCFDRMILNGGIVQFQHTKRAGTIHWFLRTQRQAEQINRAYLAKISREYHEWLQQYAKAAGIEIVEPEKVRREQWVEPYFQQLGDRHGIAVILKARERERMAVHFAKSNRLAVEFRHVDLYYFYLDDPQCGRMFLRICPYFPFNIRVWLSRRTPVLNCHYKGSQLKQYVSNGLGLRTEAASFQLKDLSVRKNVKNLPRLRKVLDGANQRYLQVQQDILASYVDRGQLQELRQPSLSATGRRLPGMRVDDPRLMAVLQAITCFAYLAGHGCFRTRDLLIDVQKALGNPDYTLGQLRYDLSKLRGKGLLSRLPRSQAYQLTEQGYRIAFFYLKLYQRLYAPLTAAIREPVPADNEVLNRHRTKLDRLYVAVDTALKRLSDHLGVMDTTQDAA